MIPQANKDALIAAIREVERCVAALGAAYQALGSAYREAAFGQSDAPRASVGIGVARFSAFQPSSGMSNLASSIGPDRYNEDIVGAMLAHGLGPLLARTAMRPDMRPIENLASEFAARVGGV